MSDARPASDVYSWAKASTKPSYSWSEITSKPNISYRSQTKTLSSGAVTGLTYPTGHSSASYLIIQVLYASTNSQILFPVIQLGTSTYTVYFRGTVNNSWASLPADSSVTWDEFWIK